MSMNAEEWLATRAGRCERLRMRLTPENCRAIREQKANVNLDKEGPPPQCEGCPGVIMDEAIKPQSPATQAVANIKCQEKYVMKNTLADLNNHLFIQLERLNDEAITPETLQLEILRSQAIANISRDVIANAALVLKAHTLATSSTHGDLPQMLEGGK